MRYVSTRGAAPTLEFEDVLLTGLARDGGLYVPETWPVLSPAEIRALAGLPYAEAAARVMRPFLGDALDEEALLALLRDAYASFDRAAVAPLKQLDSRTWLMELFHGPTLAFKDVALQVVGRLFDHVLARRGRRVTIVGATSGDTGSAAIECLQGRACAEIFMLHPRGRVSEVQRRQMTTVLADNVHNLAVDGNFDDCPAMVKALFYDLDFRDQISLSAVNSINECSLPYELVVHTGDVAQTRNTNEDFDLARELLQFNKDDYYVPGNHDVGYSETAKYLPAFEKRFGVSNRSFEPVAGLRLTLLDSQPLDPRASDADREKVFEHLDRILTPRRPTILFYHVMGLRSFFNNHLYPGWPATDRKSVV